MGKILCETCINSRELKDGDLPNGRYQFKFACYDGKYIRCLLDGQKTCRWYQHKDPVERERIRLKTLCYTCKRARKPNHDMQRFKCDFPYDCCHNGYKRCKGYQKREDGKEYDYKGD